eukprot:35247_1
MALSVYFHQALIYLLISMIYSGHSQTNQFIKAIGPNQEDIWRSTSQFIPVQSTSFGTITIGEIMSIEFTFTFGGRTESERPNREENFFRIGYTATNSEKCDGQESHYPSLWLDNDIDYLRVSYSSGSTCSDYRLLDTYNTIEVGATYHMLIAFNNSRISIHISGGGRPDWNYTATRQPTLPQFIGVEVPVWWMSNKFQGYDYNRGNATFSNITIISYTPSSNNPTEAPTMEPTTDTQSPTFSPSVHSTRSPTIEPTPEPTHRPTKDPTLDPTMEPTTEPTTHPTIEPTVNPTAYPTIEPTSDPSVDPTTDPTIDPTVDPTVDPTKDPTAYPSIDPTVDPTTDPTIDPTMDPTTDPTRSPSAPPTNAPSHAPSNAPSVAPTYSPSAAPSWSPTANLLTFNQTLYVNRSLSCGIIYRKNTTVHQEFDYYRLDISQIDHIPKMIATTCCKSEPEQIPVSIDGMEYVLTANTTSYCDGSSLDTVLYLLQYDVEKERTSILSQEDDDTRIGFCHDGVHHGKSSIDVTSAKGLMDAQSDAIEYYIAVGGYTENNDNGYIMKTGKYQLELICDKYIYPLDSAQFLSNNNDFNSQDIECEQHLDHQMNSELELVSYYYFDITKDTETPTIVSTCDEADQYDHYSTYLYIASIQYYRQEASGFTILKQETLDHANCEQLGGIDISSLDIDKYIIVVGGFNSTDIDNFGNLEVGNFSISVSCGYPTKPFDTLALITLVIVVVSIVVCCCVSFWIWYCRTLADYKDKEEEPSKIESGSGKLSGWGRYSSAHERIMSQSNQSIELNFRPKIIKPGRINTALPIAKKQSNASQSSPNVHVAGHRYRDSIGGYSPHLNDFGQISGRHLEVQDIEDHEDMDMIIGVMMDVLKSCEEEEDLDVYQVLAFRALDKASHKLKLFEPFKLVGSIIGCECKLLNLSAWHRTLFVTIVVAALQGFGITIILYSVTYEYFTDPESNSGCSWHVEDWRQSWMFKFMALLWALVITLSLSATLNGLNHTGFNQIIERVPREKYSELHVVDVGVIYIGYVINLYTLLLAVFGSYFLVYSSEEGSGAIDMVLNAVALFFMIELDDMLVTNQDYEDIRIGTDKFLKDYYEDKKGLEFDPLQKQFSQQSASAESDDEKSPSSETDKLTIPRKGKKKKKKKDAKQKNLETRESKQWFKTKGLTRLAKIVESLVFVIHFMALIGGLIAPPVIFICFGSREHDDRIIT